MNPIYKIYISRLNLPIEDYLYNVVVTTSIDGGNTFYYGGNGKYARSKEEAVKIAAQFSDEYNNATIYDMEV